MSAGDAVLGIACEPGFTDVSKYGGVTMPLRRLKAIVPNIEDRLTERIPQDNPALGLLTDYLNLWRYGERAATPEMQQTLSNHIYDLMALMFGAKGDAAEQAAQGGARAARLAQIRREIQNNALNPYFSLPALALRIGVTPRYVQQLLAQDNSSFVREMIERRMNLAHAMLRSPRHRHQSIAEIAQACGFGTDTHFYRQFRRRFGVTPGEAREGGK
jgi:AraC-like DNA-binding protein